MRNYSAWPCPDQLRKPLIEMSVIAVVVREAGPGEVSARRDEAEDRALGDFMPADIAGAELGKELHFTIGQVVVNPPRHRLPRRFGLHAVDQPRHRDTGHGSHAA